MPAKCVRILLNEYRYVCTYIPMKFLCARFTFMHSSLEPPSLVGKNVQNRFDNKTDLIFQESSTCRLGFLSKSYFLTHIPLKDSRNRPQKSHTCQIKIKFGPYIHIQPFGVALLSPDRRIFQ